LAVYTALSIGTMLIGSLLDQEFADRRVSDWFRIRSTSAIKPEAWRRIYWTMVSATPWYRGAASIPVHQCQPRTGPVSGILVPLFSSSPDVAASWGLRQKSFVGPIV